MVAENIRGFDEKTNLREGAKHIFFFGGGATPKHFSHFTKNLVFALVCGENQYLNTHSYTAQDNVLNQEGEKDPGRGSNVGAIKRKRRIFLQVTPVSQALVHLVDGLTVG